MLTHEAVDLHYVGGGSDKVYHLTLAEDSGTFIVAFAYGRRGSSLTRGEKYRGTNKRSAMAAYVKVRDEKTGKGYHVTGSNGVSGYPPAGSSGTAPTATSAPIRAPKTVSCPLAACLASPTSEEPDEAAERYLADPAWALQEKFDGERLRAIRAPGAAHYLGYNRKGVEISLLPAVQEELQLLSVPHGVLLDCESMGDKIYVFDAIELTADNRATGESFRDRRARLTDLLGVRAMSSPVQVVRTFEDEAAKRRMYLKIKAAGGEGVVFKRIDSAYSEGRSPDWVKVKFVERATCIVIGHNDVSSVQMGLLDTIGTVIPVGNVTVPTGRTKPAVDSLIEVQYLYAYEGGSLYQPVLIGPRTDIHRDECTLEQLKFKVVPA